MTFLSQDSLSLSYRTTNTVVRILKVELPNTLRRYGSQSFSLMLMIIEGSSKQLIYLFYRNCNTIYGVLTS